MIRSLLVVATLLIGVAAPLAGRATSTSADAAVQISGVKVVNLNANYFAVVWFTNVPATGGIQYGTSCTATSQTASEDPNAPSDGYVHFVSVAGLDPATTYYFKVISGSTTEDQGGSCFSQATFNGPGSVPPPTTMSGVIKAPAACTSPAPGVLVVATITTQDGRTSLPFTPGPAMTGANGDYNLVVANAMTAGGDNLNPQNGDTLHLTVEASSTNQTTYSTPVNVPEFSTGSIPTICLPNAVGPVSTATTTTATTTATTGTTTATSIPTTSTPVTVTTPGTGTPTNTPQLTVSPSSVTPGGTITVSGSGFAPSTTTTLDIVWLRLPVQHSDGSTSNIDKVFAVGFDGSISPLQQLAIPADAQPGSYSLTAYSNTASGSVLATTTVTVVPTGSTATPVPSATPTTVATTSAVVPTTQTVATAAAPPPVSAPVPSATPTPVPGQTAVPVTVPGRHHITSLHPKTFLAYSRVSPGRMQGFVVQSRSHCEVLFIVSYPRQGAGLTLDASTDGQGFWWHIWKIPGGQHGKATIKMVVIVNRALHTTMYLHFTIG